MVVHLDVFTEKEAEAFLDAYAFTDIKRREEILEWSDRLPVLMSWLAAAEGKEPDPSVPTHSIVERFPPMGHRTRITTSRIAGYYPPNF